MGFLSPTPGILRLFAASVAFAGLVLVFVGAALLTFPFKATANPETQAEVLYDVLGHLERQDDGHFRAITPDIGRQLDVILAENRLDGRHGSAYIVERANGNVVWSASGFPLAFDTTAADDHYAMQFINMGGYRLAVQNFWMRDAAGERFEFRMVVALLAN